jgi:dienelactone hydrolase
MKFTEKVLSFGAGGILHGILTEPEASQRIEGAPAVLSWNVGLHHHIGPHRFFVDMARELAQRGFTSLRFDISGLGDSEVSRDDARPDPERAISDVRAAMSALEAQRGFTRFVPVGFCSGVDAAHAVGVRDERVVGVIYLEGYGFRTPGFYLHYPERFLNPNRWERLLRRRFPRLFGDVAGVEDLALARERVYIRDYPTRERLRWDVHTMVERGTRLLLVYVGGDTDYNYREQFFEMIGRETTTNIDVTFYPKADHTFFIESDRKLALERVSSWLRECFGTSAPRQEAAPKDSASNGAQTW